MMEPEMQLWLLTESLPSLYHMLLLLLLEQPLIHYKKKQTKKISCTIWCSWQIAVSISCLMETWFSLRPHLLIFSSSLLIRSCLFSHIPLGPPLAVFALPIDINLSLHFYYLQNLLLLWGLCHPAQPVRPSVLGPWLLNEWCRNGRNDGGGGRRAVSEACAILNAFFVVVVFWPPQSL